MQKISRVIAVHMVKERKRITYAGNRFLLDLDIFLQKFGSFSWIDDIRLMSFQIIQQLLLLCLSTF